MVSKSSLSVKPASARLANLNPASYSNCRAAITRTLFPASSLPVHKYVDAKCQILSIEMGLRLVSSDRVLGTQLESFRCRNPMVLTTAGEGKAYPAVSTVTFQRADIEKTKQHYTVRKHAVAKKRSKRLGSSASMKPPRFGLHAGSPSDLCAVARLHQPDALPYTDNANHQRQYVLRLGDFHYRLRPPQSGLSERRRDRDRRQGQDRRFCGRICGRQNSIARQEPKDQ